MGSKRSVRKVSMVCLTLMIVLVYWCIDSFAYVVSKTQGGSEIKWAVSNVTYLVNPSGGPANGLNAIRAAAQTWTNVASSSLIFVYAGTTTSSLYGVNDGKNRISFGPLSGEALAQNTFWYNSSSGEILDSDIRLNTAYAWNTNGASSGFDVQNACTHELGHSLSLDDLYDSGDSEKTMYGYITAGETKKKTLASDDAAGIGYLYPKSGVEYALEVHTVGQGGVRLEPDDGIYYGGMIVEVTAAADSGWVFTEWSGDLAGSRNPETITMDDHKEITANFDPAPRYTLMIETVGQGRVTLDPEDTTYISGTTVELTATADPGWGFSKWKGDLLGLNNPETITMNGDKDIRATFIPVLQYTLTVETIGQGDVELIPDDGSYEAGTMVTIKALPSVREGGIVGVFAGWRGDLRGSENAATIAMDSNKTVSATFVEVGAANGQLTSVSNVDPDTTDETGNTRDRPSNLLYGLMEMEIETNFTGETASITVYLPNAAPPNYKWYKYTSEGLWVDFGREVISGGMGDGAVFNAERTEVTLFITDNGPYDDDPRPMIIRDPSGLGFDASSSSAQSSNGGGGGGGGCFISTMAESVRRTPKTKAKGLLKPFSQTIIIQKMRSIGAQDFPAKKAARL